MPLKTYFTVLKTGVYLSFISVFLVFNKLLFPYITSKQLYFDVLIEMLAVVWLALLVKYPEARPKRSWITFSLAGFFAALLVSTIFSVDFNLSFWGDIERMLGWFEVVHFFVFYLIIITVFRNWQDWRNLFIVSVAAATAVCFYALVKKPISTIGNTAYVSGYAIFNIFFALILFFRRGGKRGVRGNWLIGAPYLAAAFVMLLVMRVTHTRGAYVGLAAGFLLLLVLSAVFSQSRKIRTYIFAGLAAAIAAVVLVFSFPQSAPVRNSSILSTITQISGQAATFQTRLISWKTAVKDFPNQPILGIGYGNFAITFDKYFDPSFYDYTTSETYFDRAHNNLVDIASTAGLAGLLSYFFIFAAAGYYIFKGKRQGKISAGEFILLLSLFTAYFIQNLAVFDSLVTYISLMVALGYVYWLYYGEEEAALETEAKPGLDNKELAVLVIAGLISLAIIYQYNIKAWWMLTGTIRGQVAFAQGQIAAAADEYKKALSFNTGLDRDSRASFINALNSRQEALLAIDRQKAREIADYGVSLAEANVKLNPLDSMMQMQLAQSLNTAAYVNQDNTSKFYYYSDRALKAIDESIKASPGRITIYFTKAQIYIGRNDKDNALKTLQYAYDLNKDYSESSCYLAKVAIYFQEEKLGYEAMDKCLDLGGAGNLNPVDLVKIALNHYMEKRDQPRILALYERWSVLEPGDPKIFVNLSLLYAQAGNKAKAITAAEKAAELDPSLKSAAGEFIGKLKGE